MQAVEGGDSRITLNTEIRFLPSWAKSRLANILEVTHGWREVMGLVPGSPWIPGQAIPESEHYPKKYSSDDIMLVSEECGRDLREGFQVLVEEWGSSGRQRPTLADLMALLQLARLYRATDYITTDVLHDEVVVRHESQDDPESQLDRALEEDCSADHQLVYAQPTTGLLQLHPSPPHYSNFPTLEQHQVPSSSFSTLLDQCLTPLDSQHTPLDPDNTPPNHNHIPPDLQNTPQDFHDTSQEPSSPTMDYTILVNLDTSGFTHFPFTTIREITNNFNGLPLDQCGNKLGEGAFGVVFLARVVLEGCQRKVAVKKLNAGELKVEEQFKTEIEVLSRCVHENLLGLVGYSCDGPAWCLVYQYMANGSLQDCLACTNRSRALGWETRVMVGVGAARGITYLHTHQDTPLVHRDIKSANILLDQDFTPKVGDFGLVRLGSGGTHTRTLIKTTTVFGTSAYMAPEAFRGDISVKMDTFSFGIVLLELLTGLPPYDQDREGCDLLSHVQESEATSNDILDLRAGAWNEGVATELFILADLCTQAKKKRPTMVQVLAQYPAH